MHENTRDTDRAEYFSDAVIAIAATLLASSLPIPKTGTLHQDGQVVELLPALWREWPSYVGFAASFLFIGIAWANHHDMFRYIRRTDHTLLVLNLFFLMGVALYSFSTAVVVEHLGKPTERDAALLYYSLMIFSAASFNATWWYAMKGGLLLDDVDKKQQKALTKEYAFIPLLYVAALVVAIWSVSWSLLPLFASYIVFALPRFSERHREEESNEDMQRPPKEGQAQNEQRV